MRVEGNIAFTGGLLIQGEVHGNVTCDADSGGTLVVGESGTVVGALTAPHVVVGGRVDGSLHSSESIEIRRGAHVVGDVGYKRLDIHAGGVIEGLLTAAATAADDRAESTPRSRLDEAGGNEAGARSGTALKVGAVAVLLAVAVAFALLRREPPAADISAAPAAADVAPKADATMKEAPPSPSPPAPATEAPPQTATGAANAGGGVEASPAVAPQPDTDTVVLVQGVNPAKPAGVVLVIGKDAAVLFRKRRQEAGDGTRIVLAEGATGSIAIGKNEILRVATGRELQIFYQGRKVSPRTIESGAWMAFVPQSAAGGEGK